MKIVRNLSFALSVILYCSCSYSQVTLKPSIGLNQLPTDADSIPFPGLFIDMSKTFESKGLKKGDTIPHFRLYDYNGQEYDIETILNTGKPCLLIEGSYTCDVFRSRLPLIDSLKTEYGSKINIYIVYTVEAHPDSPDVVPYMGMIWVPDTNKTLGIGYRQPVTYGQRKVIVHAMLNDSRFTINVPVLIDGPQNKFWKTFNTAPNSAFLIKPDGIIYNRHGWFNGLIGPKYNIRNDIAALLKLLSITEKPSQNPELKYLPLQNRIVFNDFDLSDINSFMLYNSQGKTVYQVASAENSFSLPMLQPNIYFFSLKLGQEIFRGKILIK